VVCVEHIVPVLPGHELGYTVLAEQLTDNVDTPAPLEARQLVGVTAGQTLGYIVLAEQLNVVSDPVETLGPRLLVGVGVGQTFRYTVVPVQLLGGEVPVGVHVEGRVGQALG
jgi:hypothetical protein